MDIYEALNNSPKNEENIKLCPSCNGTGKINQRYEQQWINTSWIPSEGRYEQVLVYDTCPDCDGKGKLILKWMPE